MADDRVEIEFQAELSNFRTQVGQGSAALEGARITADELNASLVRMEGNLNQAVASWRGETAAIRETESAMRSLISTQQQSLGTAQRSVPNSFLSFSELDVAQRNARRDSVEVVRTLLSSQQQPLGTTASTTPRSFASFSGLSSVGRVTERMQRDIEENAPQMGVGLVRVINRGIEQEARNVTAFQRMVRRYGEGVEAEIADNAPRMDVGLHRAIERQAARRVVQDPISEQPSRVESSLVSATGVPLGATTRPLSNAFASPSDISSGVRVIQGMQKDIEDGAPRVSVALQRVVRKANEDAAKEAEKSAPRVDVGLHRGIEKQAEDRKKAAEESVKHVKELFEKADKATAEAAPRSDLGIRQAVERQRIERQRASLSGANFLGLNRMGALELQAAGVNSFQALASGMSPGRVGVMEGAQVAGALVQGNFFSKDNATWVAMTEAFKAVPLPLQILIGAATAAAGALVAVAAGAITAQNQLTRGQNLAALQGRDAPAARQEIEAAANEIRTSGGLGRQVSREAAVTIGTIPNVSPETRGSLNRSFEAVSRQMFEGDTDKTQQFMGSFSSPEKLKSVVDELGLVKSEAKEAFDAAVLIGDGLTASAIAAKALEERVKPASEALKATREEMGTFRRSADIFGLRFETLLNQRTGSAGSLNPFAGFASARFTPGTRAPSIEERRADQGSFSLLKPEREIAGLALERRNILGGIEKQPENQEYQRALVESDQKIAAAQTDPEKRENARRMEQRQVDLEQAKEASSSDISQAPQVVAAAKALQDEITRQQRSAAAERLGITIGETAKDVQAREQARRQLLQLDRDKISVQQSESAVERTRLGPANLSAQAETVRQDYERLRTAGPGVADQTAVLGQKNQLLAIERQVRLEAEGLAMAELQFQGVIADATGELQEQLRIQREINAVIQASPDRSDLEKKNSATATRRVEVQTQQRELGREETRSGINRAENPVDLTYQRVSLEQDLNRLITSGLSTEEQRLSKIQEIVNARRQERLEAENVAISISRQNEMLLQAQGNLAGIVALRRQEAGIIEGSSDRSQTEKIAARTQLLESQIRAQKEAQQLEAEFAQSMNRADDRRLQTKTSLMTLGLETGDLRSWQTIPAEQQLNRQNTDVKAGRIKSLLDDPNLTATERAKINEQLAELYEADAQKQIDLQTKVTSAIRAENDRRVENFRNFFKSIESSAAENLGAVLSGQKTWAEAIKSLRQNAITSFVNEAFSMGSKAIGKGIAPMLGVQFKEGDDTSISSVLSHSLGSALGLTMSESKLDQGAVADRMKQAGDAQKQAGDIILQAARELRGQSNQTPYSGGRGSQTSVAGPRARGSEALPPTGAREDSREYARRTGLVPTVSSAFEGQYTTGSPTASDPRGMEPVVRAAAVRYGHDPDVAVRVAKSEGLGTFLGDHGQSGGAFQLYTGGGMGNDFQRDTGLDPLDQKNEVATIDYAMKNLGKEGWKPWHGAPKAGVAQWEGVNVAKPQETTASVLPLPTVASVPVPTASFSLPPIISSVRAAEAPSTSSDLVGVGDSIAAHLIRKTGGTVSGKEDRTTVGSYRPGDTAVSGYTPEEIARQVIPAIPPQAIRGKDVVLSSGASNGPSQVDEYVPQQIKQLQDMQAKSVTLLGVGTRSDFAGTNDKLAEIATNTKANFTGPLRSVASDQVHTADNSVLLQQIRDSLRAKEAVTPTAVSPVRTGSEEKYPPSVHYAPEMANEPITGPKVEPLSPSVYYAPEMANEPIAPNFYPPSVHYAPEMEDYLPSARAALPDLRTAPGTDVQLTQSSDSLRTSGTELSGAARDLKDAAVALRDAATKTTSTTSSTATPNAAGTSSSTEATSSTTPNATSNSTTASGSGGLSFSSAFGVAGDAANAMNSAAQLFGMKQSPIMREITGGLGLASSLVKLGGGLSSLFGGATAATGAVGAAGVAATGGGFLSGLSSFLPFLALEGGGVIPSAAGGFQVQETSLSSSIRTGIRALAETGQMAGMDVSRIVPSGRDPTSVDDGKGGRLIVAHPDELILPASDTRAVMKSLSSPVKTLTASSGLVVPTASIVSAADGFFDGPSNGWAFPSAAAGMELSPSFRPPPAIGSVRSEMPSTIADRISSKFDDLRGGDNITNNINLSAFDGRSVAQLIASNPDAIAEGLGRSRRGFGSARR